MIFLVIEEQHSICCCSNPLVFIQVLYILQENLQSPRTISFGVPANQLQKFFFKSQLDIGILIFVYH